MGLEIGRRRARRGTMRYRRFGRTGLRMPVFSCGGMRYQESWNAGDRVSRRSRMRLVRTLARASELGIHHVETARGYGTSEAQLGAALEALGRERWILQTKVPPREDPAEFEAFLEESFRRLRTDRLDLFAFHGVNDDEYLDWTVRDGGCLEVARRFRDGGRIGHIGFSTHGSPDLIRRAIATGHFDYVNLHWYWIFRDNEVAIADARARDMGVFIISPSDKGGRLYDPPAKLRRLCRPLSPMAFNDLFCLTRGDVDTLSIGAARPSDFDEHVRALERADDAGELIDGIDARLRSAIAEAVGEEYLATWSEGLPFWTEVPGGVNVRAVLWLRNLALGLDLVEFARSRYAMLGRQDRWFPGNKAVGFDDADMVAALAASPWAETIPGRLREAHRLLD